MTKYFYRFALFILKIYWFVFRPNTFGVECLIQHENKILFIQNTYGRSWWHFPGGGINKNETPEQAAIREVKEEVDIEIINPQIITERETTIDYKHDHVYIFATQVNSEYTKIAAAEIANATWFEVINLPPNISPVAHEALTVWQKNNQI
ncbi:MAG TPA: NUDIX domain-containing protein [Candidatus Saccharimonadales bacterium]|nr:NUDIX domain-containing protein [Candidatus Saccharimonadales bacterium]